MQYKTITLSLLEAEPALYDRLKASRTALEVLENYALELKDLHEARMEQLRQSRRGGSREQFQSEALELAIADLRLRLNAESLSGDSPTA
ncbi:hypothetical protein [Tautonia marina]|uniref:hypothetical protein n=1 Tax=Tautonia marina TaxID=2653855 RepID=UPI0012611FB8|nr:hypothetical protein [Tautonia marina]